MYMISYLLFFLFYNKMLRGKIHDLSSLTLLIYSNYLPLFVCRHVFSYRLR
jgi:hypothetical protein